MIYNIIENEKNKINDKKKCISKTYDNLLFFERRSSVFIVQCYRVYSIVVV